MSCLERNKGTLTLVATGKEARTKFEALEDTDTTHNHILTKDSKLYLINYEVENDDYVGFCDLKKDESNSDLIYFHSVHFNGGGILEEVLVNNLSRLESIHD